MGKECAAQDGRQHKFTRIVMVHVQVAIAWNDLRANLRAQEIYLKWECMIVHTNHVQHNSQA